MGIGFRCVNYGYCLIFHGVIVYLYLIKNKKTCLKYYFYKKILRNVKIINIKYDTYEFARMLHAYSKFLKFSAMHTHDHLF